ncbi:MAG: hypothetical protein M3394_00035 [Actinomycetota bacterium]|nr:hypothetical protein [Actinomycetota bacterium]
MADDVVTFFGPWEVTVFSKEAWFDERFVISGSDASDGVYPGVAGTGPGAVTGARWTVAFEWNDKESSGWQPSGVRRFPTYTVDDALVITLGVDDNYEHLRDGDFDDLVVTCKSLNPQHAPLHPINNPYDFTLPRRKGKRPDDHDDQRPCDGDDKRPRPEGDDRRPPGGYGEDRPSRHEPPDRG